MLTWFDVTLQNMPFLQNAVSWFSDSALWLLFISAAISATLLPMGSEAGLIGTLSLNQYSVLWVIGVATLGNTLGGLTNYGLGLALQNGFCHTNNEPHKKSNDIPPQAPIRFTVFTRLKRYILRKIQSEPAIQSQAKVRLWISKYGYWALLFSWLPVIGDPLCFAAGWLKMKFLPTCVMIFIGKAARYLVVAAVYLELVKGIS